MSTVYEFHSAFSPEQLNWELKVFVRTHNSIYGKKCPIHLKWKGENEFTLRQTNIFTGPGAWCAAGMDRVGHASDKVWAFQDPFRGVILPDGADGSLVRVSTVPWTSRLITLFAAVLALAGVWVIATSDSWGPLLTVLFCLALLVVPARKWGKIENNLELLALLEEKLSGPPPEKE
ncbi:hypothetical protein [Colidextribacter sp. OB.20]|uniref:hypothetical protein n=1 Tax=Colidextribacter sp. OB.20 TaxID=2304568 RepID=UPI0013719870|nr:hypothetical protein [Colidextribacter sp. OB.20]